MDRADALHDLEPDGEVVDGREERRTHEEGEAAASPYAAFPEHERTDRCVLGSPELNAGEYYKCCTKNDEESNDSTVVPRIGGTAPLKRKKKADNARNKENRSHDVELLDAFFQGEGNGLVALRNWFEEEDNDSTGDATDWEINVETPSPRGLVCEGPSHQGPSNGSNTVHAADEPSECWPLIEGYRRRDDEIGA